MAKNNHPGTTSSNEEAEAEVNKETIQPETEIVKEEEKVESISKEPKYDINTFCIATKLNNYQKESLGIIYKSESDKTVSEWKKILINSKMVSSEIFN